jgi:D-alanine-D-alanine ligase
MDELPSNVTSMQETEIESEPPDPSPRPVRPWRVAVIANIKGESAVPANGPEDAGAEYDRKETIQSICKAIESDGHSTVMLSADASLPYTLAKELPDVCFNIAEGVDGDSREAQVPALLEMLHIPYTGSRVLANAVGLDKTMTKRVWRGMGLPTANYQEFSSAADPIHADMRYPLFVKPAREGTGMGMGSESIVDNEAALRERVAWVIAKYKQPALVEEYLPGREFTVGVLGRKDAALYSRRPELYGADGFHRFPVLEVDNTRSATPGVYGHYMKSLNFGEEGISEFYCPADIPAALRDKLQQLAIDAHNALNALDVSRVDIRMDADGRPCLMEINTLPGLTPDFSDLCMLGKAEGFSYTDMILEILYLGASRFGLLHARGSLQAREPIKMPHLSKVTRH